MLSCLNVPPVHPHHVDYDVVIIGAGVSGLYAAYKLIEATKLSVALYDCADKVGGRISKRDGSMVEITTRAICPGYQSRLVQLMNQMNMKFKYHTESLERNPPKVARMYMEEQHLFQVEHMVNKRWPDNFMIMMHVVKMIAKKHDSKQEVIYQNRETLKRFVRSQAKVDDQYIHEYHIETLLTKLLSNACLEHLKNDPVFSQKLTNVPNAADHICEMIDVMNSSCLNAFSVPLKTLIESLHSCLRGKVDIHLCKTLEKVEDDSQTIQLSMSDGSCIFCSNIIITTPPERLQQINGLPRFISRVITNSLEEVKGASSPYIDTWYKVSGLTRYVWKEDVSYIPILNRMSAFSLVQNVRRVNNVHICGDIFSEYQGTIEGALSSTDNVIKHITGQDQMRESTRNSIDKIMSLIRIREL